MKASEWRFPMSCPHCGTAAGTPHHVSTEIRTLWLALRCGMCQHEWTIAAPSPSVILELNRNTQKTANV
jgi:hypothetical protein